MVCQSICNPFGKFFPILLLSVFVLCSKSSIDCTNAAYNTMEASKIDQHIDQSPQYMIKKGTQTNYLRKSLTNPSSLLFKSLAALIGVVAISFVIVRCVRSIKKGKNNQLKSRRLMNENGNGECEQGAAEGGEELDGDTVYEEILGQQNVEEKNIYQCRVYLMSHLPALFSYGREEKVTRVEVEAIYKGRSREWKEIVREPVRELVRREIDEAIRDEDMRTLIEWRENHFMENFRPAHLKSNPIILQMAVQEMSRILNLGSGSIGDFLEEIIDDLSKLDGINKFTFNNEKYDEAIKNLKSKPDLSELEKIIVEMYEEIIPHVYRFNNVAAEHHAEAMEAAAILGRPDTESLPDAIKDKRPEPKTPTDSGDED